MTILRQLTIYLTILLMILFAGSLVLTIRDARHYLLVQLRSHAQDTATSVGVAIAATEPDNLADIDTMIHAVFDQGYYQQIRFSDVDDKLLVNAERPETVQGVPNWFVRIISLKSPVVATEINNGWMPAGSLQVVSHPGHAYRSLWSKIKASIVLFGAVFLLAILGLTILLNIVLRPLGRTRKQADAICERRFEIQQELPATLDMRRVVEAMNRMAGKLEQLFNDKILLTEQLRRQSVKDPLTGVLNRRAFEDRVISTLDQERGEAGGSLMLVHVKRLDALNLTHGQKATDTLLLDVARQVSKVAASWPQSFVGRRNGSEFTVFIPACGLNDNEQITEEMFRNLAAIHYFNSKEGANRLRVVSVTSHGISRIQDFFEHADQLLRSTQLKAGNSWKVDDVTSQQGHPYMHWTEEEWFKELQSVINEGKIDLFAQQVFNTDRKSVFREVFARLQLQDSIASAEAFLPMVERFELHGEFDKAVVKTLVAHMEYTSENKIYCLNLLPHSLLDDDFYQWLLDLLKSRKDIARRLILETPERTLLLVGDCLNIRVQALTETGCQFSIDQFGVSSHTLPRLHALNLSYIKVDNSFVRDIPNNQGNQLYIRTLSILASARDIELYAQGVESEEEWHQLQQIGIRGGQGFYFGQPQRL